MWVSLGVTVTLAELQGVSWYVQGGVQRFLFQLCCRLSAIFMSSLGISVLCRHRPPLPPKLPSSLHQTTVSEHLDLSTPTIIQSFYMWHILESTFVTCSSGGMQLMRIIWIKALNIGKRSCILIDASFYICQAFELYHSFCVLHWTKL